MGWYDLSPREQELDRAIERCGVKLDNSAGCLKKVCRKIGAKDSEREYVASRIALRLRAQRAIDDADNTISRIEDLLKRL